MEKEYCIEIWQSFLDILFPERCLGCEAVLPGRPVISFCPACFETVRQIRKPLCIVCGIPFEKAGGGDHLCGFCLGRGWHFKEARAVVRYQPPVTEALKHFKYLGRMHGLKTFAALSQEFIRHTGPLQPDLILPVPLHARRLRQRGFNQALILARNIFSPYRDMINPHVLERSHWLRPQTGLKGPERRRNVKNAFRVQRPELVKKRKILLIDDVFTTGATVNECARILRKAGATEVKVFTFARVVDKA